MFIYPIISGYDRNGNNFSLGNQINSQKKVDSLGINTFSIRLLVHDESKHILDLNQEINELFDNIKVRKYSATSSIILNL